MPPMPKLDTPCVCGGTPGARAVGGLTPGLSPVPSEDVDPAMPGVIVPVAPRPPPTLVPEPKGARRVAARGGGLKPPTPNCVAPNGIPVPPTAGAALPGTPSSGEPPFVPLSCARAAPLVSSSAAVAASATPRAWRAIPILPTIEASLLLPGVACAPCPDICALCAGGLLYLAAVVLALRSWPTTRRLSPVG